MRGFGIFDMIGEVIFLEMFAKSLLIAKIRYFF